MPLYAEHLRPDWKSHHDNRAWEEVEHEWTMSLMLSMSTLIEEDGGPPMAHGSGYGIFSDRPEVDHSFTGNYALPDGTTIKQGDRICMWREGIGIPRRKS